LPAIAAFHWPRWKVFEAPGVEPVFFEKDQAISMLLNEFLKEHHKVEEQATTIAQQRKEFQASITKLEATVAQQQKGMEVLSASLKEQASQIQKVSAQLELSKPAPRTVNNQ
jgi:septal ring factor EnvC (AmiA/AmiB activator)